MDAELYKKKKKKRLQKDISKAQHEQILTVFTYLE